MRKFRIALIVRPAALSLMQAPSGTKRDQPLAATSLSLPRETFALTTSL
jgi:hypothetical protein